MIDAVGLEAAQAKITELEQTVAEQQARIQALEERLARAVEMTPEKQHEFAAVSQAEGVSLSVARRQLAVVLPPRVRSVATLGRATQDAGAGRGVARGDRRVRPAEGAATHGGRDFFGHKPVLMAVEPASLCWLTGRRVPQRDGATWAGEFAQFPALRAVVRDDGTGLGKGLRLERDRRRGTDLPHIDDGLDVFHTLREGNRACARPGARPRAPWNGPRPPRRNSTSGANKDSRARVTARR